MTSHDKSKASDFNKTARAAMRKEEARALSGTATSGTASWLAKQLAISIIAAVIGFMIGGTRAAIIFFVVWIAGAVVMRITAKRSARDPS